MDLMEAIYSRRAVRSYRPDRVDEATLRKLLQAAVQAPSAVNAQPWRFVVVQDEARLRRYSKLGKTLLLARMAAEPKAERYAEMLRSPSFDIFYDASTLIVICGNAASPWLQADCWLAAQNIQLAALAFGLGTCCIGFAIPVLNAPEVKAELQIAADVTAVAPLIVGTPSSLPPPVPRLDPVVLSWTR